MHKYITYFVLLISSVHAVTIKENVQKTLYNNPEIISKIKNQEANKKFIDIEKADYLPTIDFYMYIQNSNYTRKYDNAEKETGSINGSYGSLTLEQVLYDGGLTPSEVREKKYSYKSNLYKTQYEIDTVIIDSINNYLDTIKYAELKNFSDIYIKQQLKNREIAAQKEQISGEKLEVYQVETKYNTGLDNYLDNSYYLTETLNNYKKFTDEEFDNIYCKPSLDEKLLPKSIQEAVDNAVKNNFQILEQIEAIKVQKEKIAQNYSTFLPTLSFQLEKSFDKDIELENNGEEDKITGKFILNWNLFSGGKDYHASVQEKLFLDEAKKTLETVTNDVISRVKSLYEKYSYEKEKVENLRVQAENNLNIVAIYKQEFESGTRSLIDILNAQAELYRSSIDLIDKEMEIYKTYYQILREQSNLSDSILSDNNLQCTTFQNKKLKNNFLENQNADSELSDDLIAIFDTPATQQTQNESNLIEEDTINPDINSIFNENTSNEEDISDKDIIIDNTLDNQNNNSVEFSEDADAKDITKELLNKLYENIEIDSQETNSIRLASSKGFDFNKGKYTIVLATYSNKQSGLNFIKEHKIENKSLLYSFDNDKYYKLIYSNFNNFEEANKMLSKVEKSFNIKDTFIDELDKHKQLYEKYHTIKKANIILPLDLNEGKYTIVLGTFDSAYNAYNLIVENDLKKDSLAYAFGIKPKVKVLYKTFETYKEANLALKNLKIKYKIADAFVDNLEKHKHLFEKYNN